MNFLPWATDRHGSEPLPFLLVLVLSEGGSHARRSVKKGTARPVSYQHKRRPRSALLVSKVRRVARSAQGGRPKGRKLGKSGREGAKDFLVVGDISDGSVGLTLGQVRSFDARGRTPHVRSKSAAHC